MDTPFVKVTVAHLCRRSWGGYCRSPSNGEAIGDGSEVFWHRNVAPLSLFPVFQRRVSRHIESVLIAIPDDLAPRAQQSVLKILGKTPSDSPIRSPRKPSATPQAPSAIR